MGVYKAGVMGASCTTTEDHVSNMFAEIPHSVGQPLSAAELDQLWAHYDKDKNSTLDQDELKEMMLHMFEVARKEVANNVKSDLLEKGMSEREADSAADRIREHIDAARKDIDVNVDYVQSAIARGGKITKSDFKNFFETELVSRIEMSHIVSIQEKIKRMDVGDYYDLDEELGTGQTAQVYRGIQKATGKEFAI